MVRVSLEIFVLNMNVQESKIISSAQYTEVCVLKSWNFFIIQKNLFLETRRAFHILERKLYIVLMPKATCIHNPFQHTIYVLYIQCMEQLYSMMTMSQNFYTTHPHKCMTIFFQDVMNSVDLLFGFQ
jgi:hypothetical protein